MNEQHEALLNEWENMPDHNGKPSFFRDGIIDPVRWEKAPCKLLFINKEAHDSNNPETKGFDLREIILKTWKGRPPIGAYQVVATWAYAINCAAKNLSFSYPRWDQIDCTSQREALLSSAVMNINKRGGLTTSRDTDIELYAQTDADLIKRQIDLINPEIVICGHVWYMIQHLWPNAEKVYDDVFNADGRTFIAFWHPANHADSQMKYYALAAMVQNSGALERYAQDA